MSKQTPINLMELKGRIEEQLDYGDSIAGWVRDACRLKLELKNDDEYEVAESQAQE